MGPSRRLGTHSTHTRGAAGCWWLAAAAVLAACPAGCSPPTPATDGVNSTGAAAGVGPALAPAAGAAGGGGSGSSPAAAPTDSPAAGEETVWRDWALHNELAEVAVRTPQGPAAERQRERRIAAASPGAGWSAALGLRLLCANCTAQSAVELAAALAAAATAAFAGSGFSFAAGRPLPLPPSVAAGAEWDLSAAAAALTAALAQAPVPQNSTGLRPVAVVVAPMREGLHGGLARLPWDEDSEAPRGIFVSAAAAAQPAVAAVVLAHVLGHYFGLLHTWHVPPGALTAPEQCAAAGDFVEDTPPQRLRHLGCGEADSCPQQPGTDAVDNPMSTPGSDCFGSFTPGQVARMQRVAIVYYGLAGRCGGPEAYYEENGSDYRGSVAVTVSGEPCVPLADVPSVTQEDAEWLLQRGVNLSEPPRCRLFREESFIGCYIARSQGGTRYEQCARAAVGEPCPRPARSCPAPIISPAGYVQHLPFEISASLPADAHPSCSVGLSVRGGPLEQNPIPVASLADLGELPVRAVATAPGGVTATTESVLRVLPPRLPPVTFDPPGGVYQAESIDLRLRVNVTAAAHLRAGLGGATAAAAPRAVITARAVPVGNVSAAGGCAEAPQLWWGSAHAVSAAGGAPTHDEAADSDGEVVAVVHLTTSACVLGVVSAPPDFSPSVLGSAVYIKVPPTPAPTPAPPPPPPPSPMPPPAPPQPPATPRPPVASHSAADHSSGGGALTAILVLLLLCVVLCAAAALLRYRRRLAHCWTQGDDDQGGGGHADTGWPRGDRRKYHQTHDDWRLSGCSASSRGDEMDEANPFTGRAAPAADCGARAPRGRASADSANPFNPLWCSSEAGHLDGQWQDGPGSLAPRPGGWHAVPNDSFNSSTAPPSAELRPAPSASLHLSGAGGKGYSA
eukprot:TRINITY_DN15770_c0_g1_i2.p1 TRINITY_DN15770_c0_g1~~TRINITY_DN15770_c0_g1_i2.p1  ORF type:complete len:905 (+),score=147.61 TRINITY_DN15770_c0_g1_i2:82-2796(+)